MSRQLCAAMHEIEKAGARSRADGTVNPYPADTAQYYLHCKGWLLEDLRLALIAASPSYARSQEGRTRWFDQ